MKTKRSKHVIVLLTLFISLHVCAQKHGLGCIYDPEIDGAVPCRPRLETRDYTILPSRYSLKAFCPKPKSQAQYGTCTAWSTAYGARTICEAIRYGWTDADTITSEAFSPIFVYKQIVNSPECQHGSNITLALELLRTKGAPKLQSFNVLCADFIPEPLFQEATNYKLDHYTRISVINMISETKKAVSQGHPVVFCMQVYDSFDYIKGDLWNGVKDGVRGLHAMCVIGYDDEKYGGAFEIMNSWGDDWANGGFVWIKYEDFISNVICAYDVYLNNNRPMPTPTPQPINTKYYMAGDINIIEKDGGNYMNVMLTDKQDYPHYVTTEEYYSGKKFRLSVGNQNPAWVYVIASDLHNNIQKLFPYTDNISAYLNYRDSHIAIPDETHEFELDAHAGTDFFCVLYSQKELDINGIVQQIAQTEGTFYEKLKTVLGERLVPSEDIRYNRATIQFDAQTNGSLIPLIVEISHKDIQVKYQP